MFENPETLLVCEPIVSSQGAFLQNQQETSPFSGIKAVPDLRFIRQKSNRKWEIPLYTIQRAVLSRSVVSNPLVTP